MRHAGRVNDSGTGSCSGSVSNRPFAIYVTYFDAFGAAEAMLHEMAHIKLRCFGVLVESCSRLILNKAPELYVSPVRTFKRPMTAVVHACYSWMHLTELDLRLMAVHPPRARLRLQRNCQWIAQTSHEIRTNIRLDPEGAAFFEPFYAWADRIIDKARELGVAVGS
jgi:HEXXH motif-containing protein